MTTFTDDEVSAFLAELRSRIDLCENDEGTECATLDAALGYYAQLCCHYREAVREWGRAVFAGQAEYNSEVETAFRDEGLILYQRALELCQHGEKSLDPCFELEGQTKLQSALWDLYRLLQFWVTPKRAVSPGVRLSDKVNAAVSDNTKQTIASLRPLPANWAPETSSQKALFKLKKP